MMDVTCNYYVGDEATWFNNGYVCEVTKISGQSKKSTIKKFLGIHDTGKNDADVICVRFVKKPLKVFPRNLSKKFPNLRFLEIEDCEVEKMTRKDLVGLENLECLSMRLNHLTSLPDDLFVDMKNLRRISFYKNKLERLSSKLLEPIEETLEFANFNENSKANEWFCLVSAKNSDLSKLKKAIDEKCLPPEPVHSSDAEEVCASSKHKNIFSKLAAFKVSGAFADSTISFRGKEYEIHKCILAAQSSVFMEIFTNNLAESGDTFTKIRNCSVAFESFLNYFYTGELDEKVNVIEMFELATAFDVATLQATCIFQILENLDESNALEVFNLGHHNKSEELKKSAFEVIQEMFPEMDDSFINKPDDVNYIVGAMREIDARLKKM